MSRRLCRSANVTSGSDMSRILYACAVVSLIGGSALAAMGLDRDSRPERSIAYTVLASMPR